MKNMRFKILLLSGIFFWEPVPMIIETKLRKLKKEIGYDLKDLRMNKMKIGKVIE